MKPSFSTVAGYHWATCVMKNAGVCHGIPKDNTVQSGDVITIDIGLMNQGLSFRYDRHFFG
jgi:methionine aminopeptidase